jgi:hypothetical protein
VIVGSQQIGRGFEHETDTKVGLMAGGNGPECISRTEVKAVGKRSGQGYRIRIRDKGDGVRGGAEGVFEAIGYEFLIGKRIYAHEMNKFAGMIRQGGDELNDWGDFPHGGVVPEKEDEFFGEAEALAFDSKIGTAGHEVEGGAERAEGSFVDGLNCDDGGDTDGESEEVEKGKGFMTKKITSPVGKEDAEGGEPVQDQGWMRPSTREIRRSAVRAISSLWVTRTTVVFSWRARRVIRSITIVLEVESRLPVGSSARRIEGW